MTLGSPALGLGRTFSEISSCIHRVPALIWLFFSSLLPKRPQGRWLSGTEPFGLLLVGGIKPSAPIGYPGYLSSTHTYTHSWVHFAPPPSHHTEVQHQFSSWSCFIDYLEHVQHCFFGQKIFDNQPLINTKYILTTDNNLSLSEQTKKYEIKLKKMLKWSKFKIQNRLKNKSLALGDNSNFYLPLIPMGPQYQSWHTHQ